MYFQKKSKFYIIDNMTLEQCNEKEYAWTWSAYTECYRSIRHMR